jgi:16S rRNA (cytosine1402-N4)-methyltransferase
MGASHVPVMVGEVLGALATDPPPRRLVDCTLGAGGHARAMLERWPDASLVGIDQDPSALQLAGQNLSDLGSRVRLVQGNFRRLPELVPAPVDGVLMDLGVSSMHFDQAGRGFTYALPEAPLDMRMDPAGAVTAAGLLNRLDERELARIIRDYGEERWASRIASFVVQFRGRRPMQTAGDLVEAILAAIPAAARRAGGHPARRTFQALRIAVNDELEALGEGIGHAARLLAPGGRLAIISFHSLEDRIVKRAFREHAARGDYQLVVRKPLVAGPDEIAANPRARSAKLRILGRVLVPGGGE